MYAVAQVITDKPADEKALMTAADFDAMALSMGQAIPGLGSMPAWAENDAEAQKIFVQIKREFPQLSDECAWCLITVSDGPTE